MKYNRLGKAGIKVSEISFGSWVTFGGALDLNNAKACMRAAFEGGVNFFDNAEVYAKGQSEVLMGQALSDFRREDLVISTKIFWGGEGPNDVGLSRKHLMEGINNSLQRLGLDYVDLLFCHRPDPDTPIEETVLAMNDIVRGGLAFYWGTSEWSSAEIEEAFEIAARLNCIAPSMEQPQYNMLVRDRFEKEYNPLYERYKLGTTIWSPLASGVLSGKYNDGIPVNSHQDRVHWAERHLTEENIVKFKEIKKVADDLDCTMAQLAIAWCLKNPNVSTVITGATSVDQVKENLMASQVCDRLDDGVMKRIEGILENRPR